MPRHRRLPPIPGTGLPPRGLFVSRWKSLMRASGLDELRHFDAEAFTPGVLELLFRAARQGWSLYLVGNEPAVAHGRVNDERWEAFEGELMAFLAGQGIPIQRHYACLEALDGKGKHRRDSVFHFPNTGALYHAAQEDGIDLRESWMCSADADELAAAWRAGVRTMGLEWERRERRAELEVEPNLRQRDLVHGLREVLALDPLARIL